MNDDSDGQRSAFRKARPQAPAARPSRGVPVLHADVGRLLAPEPPPPRDGQEGGALPERPRGKRKGRRGFYCELYELAPVGYCLLGADGRILEANRSAANLLGFPLAQLRRQPIRRFIPEPEHALFQRHLDLLHEGGEEGSCELHLKKSDETQFWAQLRSTRAQDPQGRSLYLTVFDDVSVSKEAELVLREQKDFFHQIAEHLSDFIAVLDLEGRRVYSSPSYQQFFGPTEGLRHTDSFAEIHPEDRERVQQVFRDTVRSGHGRRLHYRFVLADGRIRDMESQGSVICDAQGKVTHVLVVSHDITERKQLQEQVQQMAFHDALTGLPNRRLFNDRLSQALAACTRSGTHGALIFLDLDHFKPLNDRYGHEVGDLLLIEAGRRLRSGVREMDTVARFGGDEFVVMLLLERDAATSLAYAGLVGEKLRGLLGEPYVLRSTREAGEEIVIQHCCSASIGVTLFGEHDCDPGRILKRADLAMYQAKQAGGNQVLVR